MPILHAWTVENGRVVDTTLKEPERYEYLGLAFPEETLRRELVRSGVYGLLDRGMINVELLRQIDPDLVSECLQCSKTWRDNHEQPV